MDRKLMLISSIKKYIENNYIEEICYSLRRSDDSDCLRRIPESEVYFDRCSINEEIFLSGLDELIHSSWSTNVLSTIDQKGYKDSEVYKNAGISKQTFSKIRSNENYQPSRDTALQMCIGLKLNIDQAIDLLAKAGFTLSHSSKRDLVVKYFIEKEIYSMDELNDILYELSLPLFNVNI